MIKYLMIIGALVLAGCTTLEGSDKKPSVSSKKCNISGLNWKSSNKKLIAGLCALSKRYGAITVTSSCRSSRSNRGAKRSYHLYSRGCKAADIRIKGVKGSTILAWWGKNIGGGRGFYPGRGFVHVDVGPNRTWTH